jgi:nitrogen regulatory protein PII
MTDYKNTDYSLIITIVNRGYSDQVMDAAKEQGARGGTVIYARGTGIHETEKFLNISIQPEKEMVLIVVSRESVRDVTHAILEKAGLRTEGRGISFTLPVTDVVGVVSQLGDNNLVELFEDTGRTDL